MQQGLPLIIQGAINVLFGLGVLVGLVFLGYILLGLAGAMVYQPRRADEKAENVKLAITTIASDGVRNALMNTIDHTVENFSDYDIHCVIDEGADLQDELLARDDITVVIVPDEYDCAAGAKGRAINYFIENVVEDGYWYGFIDDDNLIMDDAFLYEIPYYDERGYVAMNPNLVPRKGDSLITYLADQIRFLDDITIFRFFTGALKRPYIGFHGELLCARGDVLQDITFDRPTIVEDFAFAMELINQDLDTWQSSTKVSVLSPHDIGAFFKQRRRWYLGIIGYLPNAPRLTQLVTGSRMVMWTLGLAGSWLFLPLWLFGQNLGLPVVVHVLVLISGFMYVFVGLIGAVRLKGVRGLFFVPLMPLAALIEHLSPWYSLTNRDINFVVIDK